MKNQKAILSPSVLGEFTAWCKASIEINDTTHFVLHIEGIMDRFSVCVYPGGMTYLNGNSFLRCMGENGVSIHMFKDALVDLFGTQCYDINEIQNSIEAV